MRSISIFSACSSVSACLNASVKKEKLCSGGARGLEDVLGVGVTSKSLLRLRTWWSDVSSSQTRQPSLEQSDVLVHLGVSVGRPSSVTENTVSEFVDMIRNFSS